MQQAADALLSCGGQERGEHRSLAYLIVICYLFLTDDFLFHTLCFFFRMGDFLFLACDLLASHHVYAPEYHH